LNREGGNGGEKGGFGGFGGFGGSPVSSGFAGVFRVALRVALLKK
jgi:hypothetical protein